MRVVKRKSKGLTLIELIAVLALTPLIMAAIYESMVVGYRLLNSGYKIFNVQEGAKIALNTLTNQLKNCRFYMDTEAVTKPDSGFASIPGEKICYIEGYNKERYLYVYNATEKQVYLFTLPKIQPDNYDIEMVNATTPKQYKISGTQFDGYKDGAQYSTNRIFLANYGDRVTNIHKIPSSHEPQFLFYDEYEWKMYLITKDISSSTYAKFPLESTSQGIPSDISSIERRKVMSHITSIEIKEDGEFKGEGSNKKCKIKVRAEDDGKVKELTSDVFIFEKI